MNIIPSSIETTAMEGTSMVIMPIMLAIPSPPWNLVNTECQWPKIAAYAEDNAMASGKFR